MTSWFQRFTNSLADADTKPLAHENDMLVAGIGLFILFVVVDSLAGHIHARVMQTLLIERMLKSIDPFQVNSEGLMLRWLCEILFYGLVLISFLLQFIVVVVSMVGVPLLGIPLGLKFARLENWVEKTYVRHHNRRLSEIRNWTLESHFGQAYVFSDDLFKDTKELRKLTVPTSSKPAEKDSESVKLYWTELFSLIHTKYTLAELLGFQEDLRLRKRSIWHLLTLITTVVGSLVAVITPFISFNQVKMERLFNAKPLILELIYLVNRSERKTYLIFLFLVFFTTMLVSVVGLIHEHRKQQRYFAWATNVISSSIDHYDHLNGK